MADAAQKTSWILKYISSKKKGKKKKQKKKEHRRKMPFTLMLQCAINFIEEKKKRANLSNGYNRCSRWFFYFFDLPNWACYVLYYVGQDAGVASRSAGAHRIYAEKTHQKYYIQRDGRWLGQNSAVLEERMRHEEIKLCGWPIIAALFQCCMYV